MITIKKILVPTDLSTVSVPAIGYAASLAKELRAEIVLLHVLSLEVLKNRVTSGYGDGLALPTDRAAGFQPKPDVDDIYEQKKQVVLGFLRTKLGPDLREAVKFNALIKIGKVVEETIAAANEEQCDLIVMASAGGRLRHLLGASHSERITRQAPCPVLSMQPNAHIRTEHDQRLQVKLIDQWAA